MSHTPGPWIANYNGTLGHIKSIAEHPQGMTPTVARFDPHLTATTVTTEQMNANAALICAAPDLLAACKAVYAAIEKATMATGDILWIDHALPGVHETAMERLYNVIEQAEGRIVEEE